MLRISRAPQRGKRSTGRFVAIVDKHPRKTPSGKTEVKEHPRSLRGKE